VDNARWEAWIDHLHKTDGKLFKSDFLTRVRLIKRCVQTAHLGRYRNVYMHAGTHTSSRIGQSIQIGRRCSSRRPVAPVLARGTHGSSTAWTKRGKAAGWQTNSNKYKEGPTPSKQQEVVVLVLVTDLEGAQAAEQVLKYLTPTYN